MSCDAHANFPGRIERRQVGSSLSGLIGVMLLLLQSTCHRVGLEGMQIRRVMVRFAKLMVNEQSRRHCRELGCFHRGRRCPMGKL
jgi:hypothetical protein